jgi:transmembrane 9 superfamily member 2/4
MFVNKLWSAKTQLPYSYYTLPFCRPDKIETERENIGQVLIGDRIQNSDYKLMVGEETRCNVLCDKLLSSDDIASFVEKIDNDYSVSWILDGLPAAVKMIDEENGNEVTYEHGFPLGFTASPNKEKKSFIFNHITFLVQYNQETATDPIRIVGFEVEPYTVKHTKSNEKLGWTSENLKTCSASSPITRDVEPQPVDTHVVFTYDVVWQKSPVVWANRWDMYLKTQDDTEIHWFSITNSLMIVLFMTGMIAMILVRSLYKDIARYNDRSSIEEAAEETGWKLVHGDVFRPPTGFFGPMFLSVFVGSGMQVLAMFTSLLCFAVMGFVSPAYQGNLVTAFLLLFVFMGSFAGYFSARLYKMFKGKAWKRNTFLTAFSFTGSLLTIAAFVNMFVWSKNSSLAFPVSSVFLLLGLWVFICAPLVAVGSFYGFKADEIKFPVKVNNIPRQIPPQPWYLHPIPSVLVGGILPFGSIFIELFFIMSAIWLAQIYLVFGFLFIVLVILVITCAEISIVITYFQLCSEDYNWWWRAFLTSGSSALYLFLYSIVYFETKLEITQLASSVVYFGYMGMISWVFFLMSGSVGFLSSFYFVQRIYGSIKID